MNKIWVISILTLREAIRDRILYLLLVFALIFIASSLIISKLTVGDEIKIIKDLGLSAISFFGVLIAIFIGIGLLYKEIDKKTIYTMISKPIERYQFLLGKYLGLLITLFAIWLAMSIIFLIFILIKAQWDNRLLLALVSIYFEYIIITSVAILFSSFSTPILSSIFSLCVFFIGHLIEGLKMLSKKLTNVFAKSLAMFFYYLLPNLERYNLRGVVVHGDYIDPAQLFYIIIYALIYSICLLLISIAIFQRRNFI
jgi:ABC-type transport system involved in multi-copper enzyme maturation permease subunit